MRNITLFICILLITASLLPQRSSGQITVTSGATALTLANKLVGTGVTIISATLTCPSNANGTFSGTSSLAFDSGIILTNGQANTVGTTYGANTAAAHGANTNNGTGGDAQLTTLCGNPTYDACVLEFDFKPTGDTVKFNYTFASEEYSCCTCTGYNDVFGFFISGPGYSSPTNIAVVPGTSIPVCINSINCRTGTIPLCTSIGAGSPFCSYYINNTSSTTIVYDGMTTMLTAVASVTPCDTYHLKLGIADASDHILDSGVFLEAGSLTSVNTHISPVGLNPLDTGYSSQFCVRGCLPGKFVFSRHGAPADSSVIHISIGGTATNGYDYSSIADSIIIGAHDSTDTLYIYPLSVTPTGPKTIKISIVSSLTCGGTSTFVDSAQMTILDSLTAISGVEHICVGSNSTLSNDAAGGIWSSISPTIATIGSSSGIATGVATGTSVISYSLGSGCATSAVVTVNSSPVAIAGTPRVCVGGTTALTDATTGGVWLSSTPSIATVTSGGVVTGVLPGIDTVTYTIGGCSATKVVSVNPSPSAITGSTSVCTSNTTTLSDATTGGAWTSAPSTTGTINPITGVVTGIATGALIVTYTSAVGCSVTTGMTINLTPALITGSGSVCSGYLTTLSDATTGGTWSSGSGYAFIGSGTGVVTGVSAGISSITYMMGTGCYTATLLTINPTPYSILGTFSVCTGATTTLFDAGGTWSTSGSSGILSVGSATGVVTGIATGTGTVVYTLPTGCSISVIVTVSPSPSAITGTTNICTGSTSSLRDAIPGGLWGSSDYSVAYINVSTGLVTGLLSGIAVITYSLPSGCFATTAVTVNTSPGAIYGSTSVCVGAFMTVYDGTSGGVWRSSDVSKATVNPTTGAVTGVAAGSATISYVMPGGCFATQLITVVAQPAAISGTLKICRGSTALLADASAGGIWSSTPATTATISPAGLVTGVAAGTATIAYTNSTGCAALAVVTVNPVPPAISGPDYVCLGSAVTETDGSGGTWSTGSTALTIGSITGGVTGFALGTGVITYTLPTGCTATKILSVTATPSSISGPSTLCIAQSITLTDAGSGTWSRSSSTVTIGSTSGIVTGVGAGLSTITYTLPISGCYTTKTVTVSTTAGTISGTPTVCIDATTALTDAGTGTWSSSTSAATVGSTTGIVTGISAGTTIITYSIGTGCIATATVTVNPLPLSISGTGTICAGGNITLSDGTTPGSWSTTSSLITIGSTGIVTGISGGTASVSYSLPATGCYRTATVTVNPSPGTIGGPSALCVGAHIVLTETGSGVWTSGSTGVATIGSGTGTVTGVTAGTSAITFTAPTGCTVITTITVSLSPTATTGPGTVCTGTSVTLTDTAGGGIWSCTGSATSVGSLSGIVTGITAGSAIITYSLGTGCTVTRTETVLTSPDSIAGTVTLCVHGSSALTETSSGGTWSSFPSSIATVTSAGLVNGVAAGTAIIDYSAGGCFASDTVTVNETPAAIGGPAIVCQGATITATDAVTGGTWTTASTNITIDGTTGTITGINAGTAVITYSVGSCTVNRTITVNPIGAITGATGLCVSGSTTLSNTATGGTWTIFPTTVATVTGAGVVSGRSVGTATVSYTTAPGCRAITTVTVHTSPAEITGTIHICTDAITDLADSTGGGIWSTGSGNVTIDSSTGEITGVHYGTAYITYSLGTGCAVNTTVTVDPPPPSITGDLSVCVGTDITLHDATTGGTWLSDNVGTAAIGSATGITTGITRGTTTIRYITTTGCVTTSTITVNPLPASITGVPVVCLGLTTTLTDDSTGGTWSTSGTISTVGSSTGVVTGSSTGTVVITYTLPTGCSTNTDIHVNARPALIAGLRTMCITAGTVLSDPSPGGIWSSPDGTGIITVGSATGLITGIGLGSATISYSVSGCPTTTTVTVTSQPAAITGHNHLCVGIADTLTDAGGGVWSSSNPIIATIGTSSGAVTGIIPGIFTVTYSLGTGCTVTMPATVNPSPPSITGDDFICQGATTILRDAATGGTWSSSDTHLATVGTSGLVSGISGGTVNIRYTGTNSCYSLYPVGIIHVPVIIGGSSICAWGSTLPLSDSLIGGSWTSTLVTVSPAGVVLSYAPGTASVTYTESHGCFTTSTLTVNPLPSEISGNPRLCTGLTSTLTDTSTGGSWSSTATGVATVGSLSGIVTGITTGTSVISYTLPVTGCAEIVTVTVHALPSAITGTASVCAGATTTLSDTATGGNWTSSNTSIATIDATSGLVSGSFAGTTTISYTLGASCAATRVVIVNVLPGIEGVTGGGEYCASGHGVHIGMSGSATGIHYQLYNGSTATGVPVAGTGSSIDFGLITPADTYTVTATNVATSCANNMRGSAVIEIIPSVIPGLHILSATSDTMCAGVTSHFTSAAINGGSSPVYQWAINGTAMTGATDGTYSYIPANGDVVTLRMTSDTLCASPAVVISNTVTLTVDPELIPTVVITAHPVGAILAGQPDTLTATITNGGATPEYQWKVNGLAIPGATNATYIDTNPANGDTITCAVTSGAPCGGNTAASNDVGILVFDNSGVPVTGISTGLTVLPNPNKGAFTIKGTLGTTDQEITVIITDMLGQDVFTARSVTHNGVLNQQVQLGKSIASGMYLVNVHTADGTKVFHVVVQQ